MYPFQRLSKTIKKCGYYTQRYMRNIINLGNDGIPKEKNYSQREINEVRLEWCDYVGTYATFV